MIGVPFVYPRFVHRTYALGNYFSDLVVAYYCPD
jgi:hypothetical protein